MPATFSTASSRPNSSTAARIIASTSDSFVTSQCTGSTPSPTWAAVSFSAPLTSAATTRAPSRMNALTDAFAMPEPAPVITATFPSNSPIEPSSASSNWRQDYDINIGGGATSADGAEKRPDVAHEEIGLLHRGKVAAARHVGPVHHVVSPLD